MPKKVRTRRTASNMAAEGAYAGLGEFDLIERFFAPLATAPGSLALTDDAAVLKPSTGHELVLTKDMLAADIHFFANDPADLVARKALRVNLSDLAAKGARPLGYLLGLGLGGEMAGSGAAQWLTGFAAGLAADQAEFAFPLLGGDTIRSGERMVLSITALGEVPEGRAIRRNGAKAGDLVYVSGTIGDSALGLALRLDPELAHKLGLSAPHAEFLLNRYLLPQPRMALASAVLSHASASLDISDGLCADAGHVARHSDVDLVLEADDVPLSDAARAALAADPELLARVLTGGDDYELFVCVPRAQGQTFEADAAAAGVPVARIGRVEAPAADKPAVRLTRSGLPFTLAGQGGFRHF